MKKIVLVVALGCSLIGFSQQEKIKGNKELVEKRISLPNDYHTIDVDGDFEVTLRKQSSLSTTIETDSNLLPYIDIAVVDSVLTITTTKLITRAKELKVEVGYSSSLAIILVKNDVEISVDQAIKGKKLLIEAKDNAEVKIDSDAISTEILLKGKAEISGISSSKNISIDQSGSSKAELTLINTEVTNVTLHEKSESQLMGNTSKSIFLVDNDAYLNAIKLESGTINISNTDDADVYVKCIDKAVLQLSGKSNTYIMGNPLVQLTRFEDESSIHKTKKEPSSLGRLLK